MRFNRLAALHGQIARSTPPSSSVAVRTSSTVDRNTHFTRIENYCEVRRNFSRTTAMFMRKAGVKVQWRHANSTSLYAVLTAQALVLGISREKGSKAVAQTQRFIQ